MNSIGKPIRVLGISSFYHDSAVSIIEDGRIVFAAQEERFSRIKHDSSFPSKAISCALSYLNLDLDDIDFFTFYEKPLLKMERIVDTFLENAPNGFQQFRQAAPTFFGSKLLMRKFICDSLRSIGMTRRIEPNEILFVPHHLSHASSAYYPSPFQSAIVLTVDAVGEWASTSICLAKGSTLKMLKQIDFPNSLGLFYSSFTYFAGFRVNSGEYKLMGLAPYGEPIYKELILENLLALNSDGSFSLNMDFFEFTKKNVMVGKKFERLFGKKAREPDSEITKFEMDVAASVQSVLEEALIGLVRHAFEIGEGVENICLAGGVALNCVANSKLRDMFFKNIWIQPAAGDAGGSLGAALYVHHNHSKLRNFEKIGESKNAISSKNEDIMEGAFLGPKFTNHQVQSSLETLGANFDFYEERELLDACVNLLLDGKALGWFQGRMEFGPRALGNRSILADSRSPQMQKRLNLKTKFRESFRPFAPCVEIEHVSDYFSPAFESPYMLFTTSVREDLRVQQNVLSHSSEEPNFLERLNQPRSEIPSVTHLDYSARVQTVKKDTNPKLHELLMRFKKKSGFAILINTSFNVRGEPIVCSVEDAFKCFMGTDLDALVIENFLLLKENQLKLETGFFDYGDRVGTD